MQQQLQTDWSCLPFDILETIGTMLSGRDLGASRLTCSSWRQGISWGIRSLRPRTVPNAGASAAAVGQPAKLTSFPNIETLDLRRTNLSPFQIPQLHILSPKVSKLQIMYLERLGRPREYFDQLQELYNGLVELAQRFTVEAQIYVSHAASSRGYSLSDRDLASIASLPLAVDMTLLKIGMHLNDDIQDITPLTKLTALQSLSFVAFDQRGFITEHTFRQLSSLTNLTALHFGKVGHISGAGLKAGIAGCAGQLQVLELEDCSSLYNDGLAQLTENLSELRQLSLNKVPWLTDSCIGQSLTRLTCLTRLQLELNSSITCGERGLQLVQHMPMLREIQLSRFSLIGPEQVDVLQRFPNINLVTSTFGSIVV